MQFILAEDGSGRGAAFVAAVAVKSLSKWNVNVKQ
jgi:hypothetical protein